ncbi:amino acid ABC transporter permease [Ruminiclostridium josui]|uniref:amino acid ABC transporter permease n=1 Tax=Ruminiclostridium josui TaxID=1499 RepID=UPI00046519FF|nr:amino acid ABC transporter permease [Ruminiclostridium josui]
MDNIINSIPELLKGSGITLELTLVSVVFGMLLGLFLALGRLSKNVIVDKLCWFYIWVFRGTPLMMQIFFFYYALPLAVPEGMSKVLTFNDMTAAYIALSLNSAAYLAEIIRAAIQSIDKGQMEAAKALGMSYGQAMKRVIVPQSYRRLIPPVGNEVIALLKDSALVSTIGLTELMRTTVQISNATTSALIYLPSAALYLIMTSLFTFVFERLEKKYSVYE